MSDHTTTIETLRHETARFIDEREWQVYHTPKSLSMSIAIEAAELMEHFQWHGNEASRQAAQRDGVRARFLWRKVVEADHEKDRAALNAQATAWCYLGEPLKALSLLLREVSASRHLRARAALILSLAWAMEGNLEAAKADLGIAARSLSDTARGKLPLLDWYDFDQLVQDEAIKAELRPYFEANL